MKCDCLRSSNHTENAANLWRTHRYFSKGGGKKVKDTLQKGAPFFSVSLVGANGVREWMVNSQSGASKCWRGREKGLPHVSRKWSMQNPAHFLSLQSPLLSLTPFLSLPLSLLSPAVWTTHYHHLQNHNWPKLSTVYWDMQIIGDIHEMNAGENE